MIFFPLLSQVSTPVADKSTCTAGYLLGRYLTFSETDASHKQQTSNYKCSLFKRIALTDNPILYSSTLLFLFSC